MTAHENIVDALAAAQGEFGEITKNCEAEVVTRAGGKYKYRYADLGQVLAATRPVLAKHGLAVSWVYRSGEKSGEVVTRLLHRSGSLESVIPVYSEGGTLSAMQSLGSAITYAKRYGLCGLIGVVAEDDDDGAGAGTPPRQESRREQTRQQSQQSSGQQKKQEPANQAAKQPAEKKSLLDKMQDKITAAIDPPELVNLLQKSVQQWPDKKEFLESVFELCAEENRSRVANQYSYDNAGKQQVWDDDDRKWVFTELTKTMDGLGKSESASQTNEAGPEPEATDWPARIAAVTKSEQLFALISEAAADADLTADINHFNAVCGLFAAKIEAHAKEWEPGVVSISHQHLQQRITAVELDRAHKEAMNNGQ